MDREMQAEIWAFVKTRPDALLGAQRDYEEADALLKRMYEAGLADHLPTLEEVRAAAADIVANIVDVS